MAETRVHDPAVSFRFQVNIQGKGIEAGFSKVTGLRDESEAIEYREGADPTVKTQIPGLRTFPALVLERGMMTQADRLIEWRREVIRCLRDNEGRSLFRATTQVTVHNCDGAVARTAEFQKSWPNALALSDLDGGASEVNIESVELKHEGQARDPVFRLGGPGGPLLPKRSGL